MTATFDALVAENRELRRELKRERERLRALERSRWWRLHPRRLLGRGGVDHAHPLAPASRAATVTPRDAGPTLAKEDPALARFAEEVVARGAFTQDWATSRFAQWRPLLDELEGRPARILEVGTFEGLSTCFLLWRLPRARLTCIDTFEGSPEHVGVVTAGLEASFDANIALVDASRVTKLVGDSKRRLLDLSADGAQFDLVYVDGSHLGLDVLVDAALSWNLLTPRGVVVFDDYRWADVGTDPLLRPGPAIDAFRLLVAPKHEVLFEDHQIALRRIS